MQSSQKSRTVDFKTIHFPIKDFVQHLSTDGKSKLQTYRFPAKDTDKDHPPKGVIVMYHGYGSYVGKFAYVATKFADVGFDTIGFDFKGFGLSEGARALIEDEVQFLTEAYDFVKISREYYNKEYPNATIPFISYGYSMGGATAIGVERLFGQEKNVFNYHVLIAPNMGVEKALQFPEEKVQEFREIAKAQPNAPLFPFNPNPSEFLKEYYADELQYKGPVQASTYIISMLDMAESNQQYGHRFNAPILITQGKNDVIVSNSRQKEFFAKIATPDHLKELKTYETEHYILSDGWVLDQVVTDQIDWINAKLKLQ